MKELTEIEAALIMIKGGEVDYWYKDYTKGRGNPLTWNKDGYVQDRNGYSILLGNLILTEHVPPKSVELDVWVNVYSWGLSCTTWATKEEAINEHGRRRGQYINTINIKQRVTEEV